MEELLKYSYLFDADKLNCAFESKWKRYQDILANPNWDGLNEARAILYVIGYIFPEQIAPEAIKRRLHLLAEPLNELDFYQIVDLKNQIEIDKRKDDPLFKKMVDYYLVVKKFKNLSKENESYLDEDRFIKLYNQHSPDQSLTIGKFGEFNR